MADTPRRSTRAKNPLPPSSGPLFPPLPPKQPRHSRSPRVSQVKVKQELLAEPEDEDSLPVVVPVPAEDAEAEEVKDIQLEVPEVSHEPVDVEMEVAVDEDVPDLEPEVETQPEEQQTEEQEDLQPTRASPLSAANLEAAAPDDWENYRKHRGVRGFGAASSTSSTSERKTRKRRGEEQLLVAEYLAAPDAEAEGEDGEGDGDGDEEDRGDVTRCVCGREGGWDFGIADDRHRRDDDPVR